ncbi:McrB family protein [Symbiobacterium terraclitae]|uniref:McrB family protein n=1 Tax=Symbiobacterium terraclitae TaxID=557451 RepID=UPI0035B53C4A
MADALTHLASAIAQGLPEPPGGVRPLLEALFGGRYHKTAQRYAAIRDPLGLDIPYAGFIHPDNPTSGAYGGASLVWFPTEEAGSIITLVVGTAGLSPDEGLLSRPGHRRRVRALRRYLTKHNIWMWVKPDPTALGVPVPEFVQERLDPFRPALRRYGGELYAIAEVPKDVDRARIVVQAFFDLYAYERGWKVLQAHEPEYRQLVDDMRADLFAPITEEAVYDLLSRRHFVILQGPPGTGKTRVGEQVKQRFFGGRGATVQFHPAVTYEDFVVGLSPRTDGEDLHFTVRPGWLLEASKAAQDGPYLLVIDEINRADLGKVLGEAIYLLEPGEIGREPLRTVQLPHAVDGTKSFAYPANLFILGTMNTADRSIATLDLAVRRRFAFMTMRPDPEVVKAQGLELASRAFAALQDVFVEYAPDEALDLLPGHSYFLARDDEELKNRFRYELLPLLDEYLREGMVGSFAAELQAVRDQIEDVIQHGSWPE